MLKHIKFFTDLKITALRRHYSEKIYLRLEGFYFRH